MPPPESAARGNCTTRPPLATPVTIKLSNLKFDEIEMFLFVHVLILKNPLDILFCIVLFDSFFLLEASFLYGTAVRGVLTAHSQSSILGLIILPCHVTSDNRTSTLAIDHQ